VFFPSSFFSLLQCFLLFFSSFFQQDLLFCLDADQSTKNDNGRYIDPKLKRIMVDTTKFLADFNTTIEQRNEFFRIIQTYGVLRLSHSVLLNRSIFLFSFGSSVHSDPKAKEDQADPADSKTTKRKKAPVKRKRGRGHKAKAAPETESRQKSTVPLTNSINRLFQLVSCFKPLAIVVSPTTGQSLIAIVKFLVGLCFVVVTPALPLLSHYPSPIVPSFSLRLCLSALCPQIWDLQLTN
jgi:hypothetical protein